MDGIKTSLDDPECKEAFLRAFQALCESDRRIGQLPPETRKHLAGDQTGERAA